MKKQILLTAILLSVSFLSGTSLGILIGDGWSRSSAFSNDVLKTTELRLEKDYNATIDAIDNRDMRITNRVAFMGNYNEDNRLFYKVCELKRVAFCRYEWVEE